MSVAIVAFGAIIGIAIGSFFSYNLTVIPSGYVAPYTTIAVLAVTVFLGFVGSLLLFVRPRAVGFSLVAAGVFTCITYPVGWRVLRNFDRIPWLHSAPPAIHLAAQSNTVLIHFKQGVTDEQVDAFTVTRLPFLPIWCDSLTHVPSTRTEAPLLELTIRQPADQPAGSNKVLSDSVSAFMVKMRREQVVSAVDLQSQP